MSVSIVDLLDSFPAPGEDFVLRLDLFELPELYELLGTGKELVLKETEVPRGQLTMVGQAVLVRGERTAQLTLTCVADSANEFVGGVAVRVVAALALVELATAWAVDFEKGPRVFLADLTELVAHCQLAAGSVAITASAERLRLIFATPTADSGMAAIGVKATDVYLSESSWIGEEISGAGEVGVRGAELVTVGCGVTAERGAELNAAAATVVGELGRLLMPDRFLETGLRVGVLWILPDREPQARSVGLGVPDVGWLPVSPRSRRRLSSLPDLGRAGCSRAPAACRRPASVLRSVCSARPTAAVAARGRLQHFITRWGCIRPFRVAGGGRPAAPGRPGAEPRGVRGSAGCPSRACQIDVKGGASADLRPDRPAGHGGAAQGPELSQGVEEAGTCLRM